MGKLRAPNILGATASAASPAGAARRPHLVHIFPSFAHGGVPIRIANMANRLQPQFRHSFVALDGCFDCAGRLGESLDYALCRAPAGATAWRRLWCIDRYLGQCAPDLVLTYNWGAIEWALVNGRRRHAPHLHFESGFGPEEADRQLRRRVLLRRFALRPVHRLVVPSRLLLRLARESWRLPDGLITRIPNGVDCTLFRRAPDREILAGINPAGLPLVGTVAPLRREKDLPFLLRSFSRLLRHRPARLLVMGDGPEMASLNRLAAELGIAAAVHFAGHVDRIERLLGGLDLFALSSQTEQMPNSVLQAMAAGLPVVARDVGDVAEMLAGENAPFVSPREDEAAFTRNLGLLLDSTPLRQRVGLANARRAEREFSEEKMAAAYGALYQDALRAGATRRVPRARRFA